MDKPLIDETINHLTQDIIKEYNIDVPISDIDTVITTLGGCIRYNNNISYSTIKNKNAFIISIPKERYDYVTHRYRIAFELGNLFLHMGYKTNDSLWTKQPDNKSFAPGTLEQIAISKQFAYAFLMPEHEYMTIADLYQDNNEFLTPKIAEHFGVSVSMASQRGQDLHLFEKRL